MEKKFDLKKFLSNNAIIILIILLALFVGCTTQNFFTEDKRPKPAAERRPAFHHRLRRFGMPDYQGHRPVRRPPGRPGRLLLRHAAAEC